MIILKALLILLNTIYVVSECFNLNATTNECAADPSCIVTPGSCYRTDFELCNTSELTCGSNCVPEADALALDSQTCSRCTDVCRTLIGQSACEANLACSWNPEFCNDRLPCQSAQTKGECLAEDGCHWFGLNFTQCGISRAVSLCMECEGEDTLLLQFHSAMQNSVGKTCHYNLRNTSNTLQVMVTDAENRCEQTLDPDAERDESFIVLIVAGIIPVANTTPFLCTRGTVAPTRPSRRPTREPTLRPSLQPTTEPTRRPSHQPTIEPTRRPSRSPTERPTRTPTRAPTLRPSRQPTIEPTRRPSRSPTERPTRKPTRGPTLRPSRQPTTEPTRRPSRSPTEQPTRKPTKEPTSRPSRQPTTEPTLRPSRTPTFAPTRKPTRSPTHRPSRKPTMEPTLRPSRT